MIIGILLFLNFPFYTPLLLPILIGIAIVYLGVYYLFGGKARSFLGALGIVFLITFGYFNASKVEAGFRENHFSKITYFQFYSADIVGLVEEKPNSWKTIVQVKGVFQDRKYIPVQGKVLLYLDKLTVPKPEYGESILIKGQPVLIEGPKNPFQFDYKKYLSNQGIYFQQYLRDTSLVNISSKTDWSLNSFAFKINSYSDSIFTKYIPNKTELGVTNAMVLGLRDDIDNELMAAYSAAGAIHVLSVSGLHVGVIYIILVWVFGRIKKVESGGKWFFLLIILSILWLYAAVTGFSSPVLRSTFMFSLILIAQTIDKQENSYNTVAISSFVLLVYDPFMLTNIGFMLSYLAVFGMIQIQPLLNPLVVIDKRKSKLHWLTDRLWKVTTVAIAAQIATLPITIYYFHQFPNYFLLANPIVILLSSIVLIGGLVFLLIALILSWFNLSLIISGLGLLLQFFVKALNATVIFTESLPGAISKFLNFSIVEMLILYFLLFCILALIHTKKYGWVQLGTFSAALLIGLSIANFLDVLHQKIICLHAVPKTTAISVINGRRVQLMGEESFISSNKNIQFNFANFWASKGVVDTNKISLPVTSSIQIWKGQTFLFLNDRIKEGEKLNVDFLVIRNKKLQYFKNIKNRIAFKYLIIDGSLSNYYTNRFQQEAAQDGVLAYSLMKNGALIL